MKDQTGENRKESELSGSVETKDG